MNAERDLYFVLGVEKHSNHDEIKAAYRKKASQLHPDKNPGKNTTAAFQELQQAYEVLSDPERRVEYDAMLASVEVPRSEEDGGSRLRPVRCSRCDAVSAQPHYRVFFSVFGYLFGATKTAHQGVLCATCENKVALIATAKTLVLGWWSVHGFVWTLETLARNLTGGKRFPEQDVRLQAVQAMYFASIDKMDLARAVAHHAYGASLKIKPGTSAIAKVREKLGYKAEDPLADLRSQLKRFLDSFDGSSSVLELKDAGGVFNRRFATQAALIGGVALTLGGWIALEAREARLREEARLEAEGLERARAAAIAREEEEALRAMEQPLPKTGPMGRNRAYLMSAQGELPPFKIVAPIGRNYLVKLIEVGNESHSLRAFVRGGETADFFVPPGNYRMRLAAGKTWYGEEVRFGPATSYAEMEQILAFRIEGEDLLGHEIQLAQVRGGNLGKHVISASDF